jgi:hypothetical protein
LPKVTFYLLERAHALALEMAFASDGINRRSREAVLYLQAVPNHAFQEFSLRFRHKPKLPSTAAGHKTQLAKTNDSQDAR